MENIRQNIPRMKFEGGQQGMILLADQVEALSPQLYVQLVCQVDLLHDITTRAITYFAQRFPATLREFRWRIDQKNVSKTAYEEAFEKIAPALLQTRSFREPMLMVKGFDYRHFHEYEFEDGQMPDYLQTEYGLPAVDGINVQKLIRGNLKFEDSNSSDGIQVADLLASGIRRALRGSFGHAPPIAHALGALTLQNVRGKTSINLLSFSQAANVCADASSLMNIMSASSKVMLSRSPAHP